MVYEQERLDLVSGFSGWRRDIHNKLEKTKNRERQSEIRNKNSCEWERERNNRMVRERIQYKCSNENASESPLHYRYQKERINNNDFRECNFLFKDKKESSSTSYGILFKSKRDNYEKQGLQQDSLYRPRERNLFNYKRNESSWEKITNFSEGD